MSDMTNTGINLNKAISDGSYNLKSLSMSFDEACLKLAAFRKGKTLSLVDDQGLEFENDNDDEKN